MNTMIVYTYDIDKDYHIELAPHRDVNKFDDTWEVWLCHSTRPVKLLVTSTVPMSLEVKEIFSQIDRGVIPLDIPMRAYQDYVRHFTPYKVIPD